MPAVLHHAAAHGTLGLGRVVRRCRQCDDIDGCDVDVDVDDHTMNNDGDGDGDGDGSCGGEPRQPGQLVAGRAGMYAADARV